jgi:hypothetical protein
VNSWWKYLAVFLTGLLLGGAVVGFGLHYYMERRENDRGNTERILNRLSSQLNLTEGQKNRVAALLKVEAPKMEALRKDMEKKSHALWMSFDGDLRPLLDADQRNKLDDMEARWREQHKFGRGDHDTGDAPITEIKP